MDINEELDELRDRGFTAAVIAAKFDKLDALHYLDMRGADLNTAQSVEGNTPLMSAVINWQGRIVDYLLERGVDPFLKDKYGFTALQKAELRDLQATAAILKDYEQKYKAKKVKPKHRPKQAIRFRKIIVHKPYYYEKRINPETFLTLGVHPFSGRIRNITMSNEGPEIEYLGQEFSVGIFGNFTKFSDSDPMTFTA